MKINDKDILKCIDIPLQLKNKFMKKFKNEDNLEEFIKLN